MTDTCTKSTEATREYIRVNWPEILDLDTCMQFVQYHEKEFYIDDIVAFYLRYQEGWPSFLTYIV